MKRTWSVLVLCWLVSNCANSGLRASGAELSPPEIAAEVDRLLNDEVLHNASSELAPKTSDAVFLRRVYLDVVGQPPTPNEITRFALDFRPDKRQQVVKSLLEDPAYGVNWGRYWRDVVLYRRAADQLSGLLNSIEPFLVSQLNRNVGWDEIARSFVTAKGNSSEHGETSLFLAQLAQPVEVAAEVSRIFLGIQIQCAQCHDHPTDRWKRQQFHEFAAFFPRAGINRARNSGRPGLELASFDNGQLVRRQASLGPGALEHFMPNLKDPADQGTMMTPVFFVTGQKLQTGATDDSRRQSLAGWMTGPTNPWFAKALVNRLWAELVGEGFYEPIDDLGPDRTCSAPRTIDYLAQQFIAHRYDLKWLLEVITATDAYQRESHPRRTELQLPFVANVAQPLRGDQLANVLSTALGVDWSTGSIIARGAPGAARSQIVQLFGFDPSARRDEVTGTIPQALLLMNSGAVNQSLTSPTSELGRLMASGADDEQVVLELYLRCLSREPNEKELATCLEHIRAKSNRTDGLEDIYWTLLNSEELRFRN